MSTYPTSAEVADLRYRINPDMIDCLAWSETRWNGITDGASAREREHGIGHQIVVGSGSGPICVDGIWSSQWRRLAGAMRNNAYWSWTADRGRLDHDLFAPGWSRLYPMSRCAPHDIAAGQS